MTTDGYVKAGLSALAALSLSLTPAGCDKGDEPALSQPSAEESPAASADSGAPADAPSASASAEEVVIPPPGTPIVDLNGITTLPAPLGNVPKVGATSWVTRIYATPSTTGKVLGFLRAGAIVQTTGTENTRASKGCDKGWRNLVPAGFVCMDDVTEDLSDPIIAAITRGPDYAHRLPYMYGTVTRGGPVYAKVPSQADLEQYEPNLDRHIRKWKKDNKSGASYGLDVWLRYTPGRETLSAVDALKEGITDDDLIPHFLKDEGRSPDVSGLIKSREASKIDQVNRRQGRSFIYSFLKDGRRYNVTPDLVVVPADRFRPIRGSAHHGVKVDESELKFPFAFIRRKGAKKWTWRKGKSPKKSGDIDYRAVVQLTGKQQIYKKRLYYQTEEGFYVDDRHASRVDPAKRWPKWAKQGAKWIDVRLSTQVLVAYEGKKMVFATLISSGEAGLEDPSNSTATTRGIFRIHTKHVSITMDSEAVGEEFELRDVPYVQYFEGGYALHGAYWHDSFGRPKSHGCINLSPEDARRLFFWTDPPVPVGWHGAAKALTGTIVFVHP